MTEAVTRQHVADLAGVSAKTASRVVNGEPDDLSVAGCDDSYVAEVAWPPLTTIHQPISEMASEAVSLLLSPRTGTTRHLTLPMRLVVRGSTGRPGTPRPMN